MELANRDTTTILALDLGKFKSVACVYRRGGTPAFRTIASTRAALTALFDGVGDARGPFSPRPTLSRCEGRAGGKKAQEKGELTLD
jgi:hypothetical protein